MPFVIYFLKKSVFNDFCDVDLHDWLEESEDSYTVHVAGDRNSRTGTRDDFIYNDNWDTCKSVLSAISPICNYDEEPECFSRLLFIWKNPRGLCGCFQYFSDHPAVTMYYAVF